MGHIRRRGKPGSNKWDVQVSVGKDGAGKKKYHSETVHGSYADAQRRERALEMEKDRGVELRGSPITVGEYLEQWLNSYGRSQLKVRTLEGYQGICLRYLIPQIGHVRLNRLTAQQVENAESHLLLSGGSGGGPLSGKTVLQARRVLSSALGHAVGVGLVRHNVAKDTRAPRVSRCEAKWLKWDELRRLTANTNNSLFRGMFLVAAQTGLRRSELLGLQWQDVDWDNRKLSVRRGVTKTVGRLPTVSEPKSGRGRALDLFNDCIGLLHQRWGEAGRLGLNQPTDFIFSFSQDTPMSPFSASQGFRRAARKAGLIGVRLHDLRHTHATMMFASGASLKVVSERLGHSSVAITADIYGHVIPTMQREAVERFGEMWRSGMGPDENGNGKWNGKSGFLEDPGELAASFCAQKAVGCALLYYKPLSGW